MGINFRLIAVTGLILGSLSACQINKMVADNMTLSMDDQKTSFYHEKNLRHAREAAPAMLKLLDGFIVSSPENEDLLVRAAEMNCGFSMLMIEPEDREWASDLYMKGYDYAIRALEHSIPDIQDILREGGEEGLKAALAEQGPDSAPSILWAGLCLGSHMNINIDDVAATANMSRVLAFMDRAVELDPTYYFGAPDMFLGVYYGFLGVSLGGKPDLSLEHFNKAFAVTDGRFLLAKILFAKTYCVQIQDRALFEKTLNDILATPNDKAPEFALVTAAAKKQAAVLLAQVDDLFI